MSLYTQYKLLSMSTGLCLFVLRAGRDPFERFALVSSQIEEQTEGFVVWRSTVCHVVRLFLKAT